MNHLPMSASELQAFKERLEVSLQKVIDTPTAELRRQAKEAKRIERIKKEVSKYLISVKPN
jgi:hypothetical protein